MKIKSDIFIDVRAMELLIQYYYARNIYEKYLQMEKTLDIEDKVEALWKITEEFCDYLTYKNSYSRVYVVCQCSKRFLSEY